MIERAVGTHVEVWFISQQALAGTIPNAHWKNGETMLWSISLHQDPALAALQRLGAETVTDVVVHGVPAFITTIPTDTAYRSLTWVEDGRTFLVGSRELTDEQLVAYADSLRPATATEWEAMKASAQPVPEAPASTVEVASIPTADRR